MGTTDIAVTGTAPAPAPAKQAAKPRKAKQYSYAVTTDVGNPKHVQLAAKLASEGKPQAVQAAALSAATGHNYSTGEYARKCLQGGKACNGRTVPLQRYGTSDKGAPRTPTALALACATDWGRSWGVLGAQYGVTEGTCKLAYTAVTGLHPATKPGAGAWRGRRA